MRKEEELIFSCCFKKIKLVSPHFLLIFSTQFLSHFFLLLMMTLVDLPSSLHFDDFDDFDDFDFVDSE